MVWAQVFGIPAILTLGVVFGTDMFFAVVGRAALAHVSEAGITEVMGRFHEYADRRMPFFGILAMICTLGVAAVAPSFYPIMAFVAELLHLGIYFRVSKPVNAVLTAAANRGESLSNAGELQRRWDSVIVLRALALGVALLCVVLSLTHA